MATRITFTGPTLGSPEWMADYGSRDHLVPGGHKVNSADAGFVADGNGRKPIPSGTPLGRTIAERDAGTGFGPAAATDPETEVFLLAFDVSDALKNDDCELYRPGSVVKENFLPGFGSLVAGVITFLRNRYIMVHGSE